MSTKRKKRTKDEIKKRKAKFNNKKNEQLNQTKKYYEQQQRIRNLQEDLIRRASIVENIYKAKKNDFAVVKDNTLQLNEDKIKVSNDGILCWVEDNNPVLSGESLENYTKYSKEFVNDVLSYIYKKENPVTDVNIDDFELVVNEENDNN
jgi:hypothetical protein